MCRFLKVIHYIKDVVITPKKIRDSFAVERSRYTELASGVACECDIKEKMWIAFNAAWVKEVDDYM